MKKFLFLLLSSFISFSAYAQGFIPTDAQKAEAENIFRSYLNYVTEGKYERAYELQTESMKRLIPLSKWSEREQDFKKRSGGNARFGNIQASWAKDPPNAESPGIYTIFQYACRYENINICSEVVILHSKTGQKFNVLRHERNTVNKEQ